MNSSSWQEEIVRILRDVRQFLEDPQTDVAWSHYNSVEEAMEDIDQHIQRMLRGDVSGIDDLTLLFAPTGSLQEISISNGWGQEFLVISAQFDKAIESLRRQG